MGMDCTSQAVSAQVDNLLDEMREDAKKLRENRNQHDSTVMESKGKGLTFDDKGKRAIEFRDSGKLFTRGNQ